MRGIRTRFESRGVFKKDFGASGADRIHVGPVYISRQVFRVCLANYYLYVIN